MSTLEEIIIAENQGMFSVMFHTKRGNLIKSVSQHNNARTIHLHNISVIKEWQGRGHAKGFMRSLFSLSEYIYSETFRLNAKSIGSYAWTKYGFIPDQESWNELREDIKTKIPLLSPLSNSDKRNALDILNSHEPRDIWKIADLSCGKQILCNNYWDGSLDKQDERSMTRFKGYCGI